MDRIFDRVRALLKTCESPDPSIPPTTLFNEGWMLRLVLDGISSAKSGKTSCPIKIPSDCKWYSEAWLPTAFPPKKRSDSKGESWTHADGVIGHFEIGKDSKAGLTLEPKATHFVVLEAKMFSKLSKGTTHAAGYDQAARTVACMAEVLKRENRKPNELRIWNSTSLLQIRR